MNSLFILSIKQWFTFILVGSSLLNPILGMSICKYPLSDIPKQLLFVQQEDPFEISIIGRDLTISVLSPNHTSHQPDTYYIRDTFLVEKQWPALYHNLDFLKFKSDGFPFPIYHQQLNDEFRFVSSFSSSDVQIVEYSIALRNATTVSFSLLKVMDAELFSSESTVWWAPSLQTMEMLLMFQRVKQHRHASYRLFRASLSDVKKQLDLGKSTYLCKQKGLKIVQQRDPQDCDTEWEETDRLVALYQTVSWTTPVKCYMFTTSQVYDFPCEAMTDDPKYLNVSFDLQPMSYNRFFSCGIEEPSTTERNSPGHRTEVTTDHNHGRDVNPSDKGISTTVIIIVVAILGLALIALLLLTYCLCCQGSSSKKHKRTPRFSGTGKSVKKSSRKSKSKAKSLKLKSSGKSKSVKSGKGKANSAAFSSSAKSKKSKKSSKKRGSKSGKSLK